MFGSDGYEFALKKDVWSEMDIVGLFKCFEKPTPLINLIRTGVAAKTLIPIATQQAPCDPYQYYYCFVPFTIMEWAIAKRIKMPDELRKWYDEKNRPKAKEMPAYLDDTHPLHSSELRIAIEAWESVLQPNPDKPKTGTRKQLIENWVNEHHPKLKKAEIDRITTMLNPDKAGGAPKTE